MWTFDRLGENSNATDASGSSIPWAKNRTPHQAPQKVYTEKYEP